jgi:hypothetical protein
MEYTMIKNRHHKYTQRLQRHLEKLERLNDAEEQQVIAEVARIKRSHIRKFGRPKPATSIPLSGIASENDGLAK